MSESVPGEYYPLATYRDYNEHQKAVTLEPIAAVTTSAPEFLQAMYGISGGSWVITTASASTLPLVLSVKSYRAIASSTTSMVFDAITGRYRLAAGGSVGAGLLVETNWVQPFDPNPAPDAFTPKGKWIQVFWTNTPSGDQAINTPIFDVPDPALDPPFEPIFDQSGYFDEPRRPIGNEDVEWHAQLFFAIQTGPKALTVYDEGLQWGWQTGLHSSPWATPELSASSSVNSAIINQQTTIAGTLNFLPGFGTPNPSGVLEFVEQTNEGSRALGIKPLVILPNGKLGATLDASFDKAGDHIIYVTYNGDANWYAAQTSFIQTVKKAGAGVQVDSSANVAVVNRPITFTATVTDTHAIGMTPTGTVTFYDGETLLDTATLDATGTARLVVSLAASGDHTISALYSDDAVFDSASASRVQQIVPPVSGRVWTDTNRDGIRQTDEPGRPAVSVHLLDMAGSLVDTAVTDSAGDYHFLSVPTGQFAVVFGCVPGYGWAPRDQGDDTLDSDVDRMTGGSDSFLLADQTFVILDAGAVVKRVSSTSLSADLQTTVPGQTLTLTASVYHADYGGPALSGTVAFYDGETLLATVPVTADYYGYGAQASFASAAFAAGQHSITAVYSGDNHYNGSASSTTVTIQKVATYLSLGTSTSTAIPGQEVTITASIYPGDYGLPSPTGMVAFYDGPTLLAALPVSASPHDHGGEANLTTSNLDLGSHGITAVYTGDDLFLGSTAGPVTLTVQQTATSVFLHVDATTLAVGQTVSLTATVWPAIWDGPALSGTVTFRHGAIVLGSVALSQGMGWQATLTTTALGLGSASLTAYYSGCAAYAGSDSAPVSVLVVEPGAISGRAWIDLDGDGVQDPGEAALAGVHVRLLYASGSDAAPFATTASDGSYSFSEVMPGDYYLQVYNLLPGYTASPGHVGSPTLNNDFNGAQTGPLYTDFFTLASGQVVDHLDAGLMPPA